MEQKTIKRAIITTFICLVFLFGGYYFGMKDSYTWSCVQIGGVPIIKDDNTFCIRQENIWDQCDLECTLGCFDFQAILWGDVD